MISFFKPSVNQVSAHQSSWNPHYEVPTITQRSMASDVFNRSTQNHASIQFGHSFTPVYRLANPRPEYIRLEPLHDIIARYSNLIPDASDVFSEDLIGPIEEALSSGKKQLDMLKNLTFKSRRGRLQAFYTLLVHAENSAPVQAGQIPGLSTGDIQLEQMKHILDAVEGEATLKTQLKHQPPEEGHILIEDPTIMKVQLGDKKLFEWHHGQLIEAGETKVSYPYFQEANTVVVIPSTCEYTLVDSEGRILIVRVRESMRKERLYPYKNLSAGKVNEALKHGQVILSIPKNGTNLCGQELHQIYIHPEWTVNNESIQNLPEAQKRRIETTLGKLSPSTTQQTAA